MADGAAIALAVLAIMREGLATMEQYQRLRDRADAEGRDISDAELVELRERADAIKEQNDRLLEGLDGRNSQTN